MTFLQEIPDLHRFSLASLLMFVTIVVIALARPYWTMLVIATVPFLLTGLAMIAMGWRAQRHRWLVRCLSTLGGLGLLAVAAYAAVEVWPG
jgi:hypothetical protein